LNFDIYIIGRKTELTEHGVAHQSDRQSVSVNVPFNQLKVKLKMVLANLAHSRYGYNGFQYYGYEVYPAGTTKEQFPAYQLLTNDPVPCFNEFLTVRNATGNFDTHRRWKQT